MPLGAKWLINAFDLIKADSTLVVNGFAASSIKGILK